MSGYSSAISINKIVITTFLLYTAGVGTLVIGQTDAGAPAAQPRDANDQNISTEAPQSTQPAGFQGTDHILVVINFAANNADVSGKQLQILRNSLDSARTDGAQLDRVVVAAWSDSAQPLTSEVKLPGAAMKLADDRARNIEGYLREIGVPRVDTYSMAEHANLSDSLFKADDARIKETGQSHVKSKSANTSLTEQLASKGGPKKALVLIFCEKPVLAH